MIKAVIFDVGGVLHGGESEFVKDIVQELGLSSANVSNMWKQEVVLLGSGKISEQEFWNQLSRSYGVRQADVSENLLGRSFANGIHPHLKIAQLVAELKSKDPITVVFSNTVEPHAAELERLGYYKNFDKLFLSHKIGYRKPDPKSYNFVIKSLKIRPEEAIFIDDDQKNIEAANSLGLNGVLFKSENQTISDVKNLLNRV